MKSLLAQVTLGNFETVGPHWQPTNQPLQQLERVISIVIGVMTVFGGIYFLFLFIVAAYNWMSAGGDKNKLQMAQNKIVHAVIGLVVVIGAYALVSLIGYILGFCILQPSSLLEGIWES
jgi:hypothetical protein